ncbi:MAG: hypothetical protein Q4B12_07615 [Bowdeniella nasicola]|nr:hypothetical protein [Bowdeniella nasicola]
MEDVPVENSGEASGLQTTVRQMGSALRIALLGGMMIGQLASHSEAALREDGIGASFLLPAERRTQEQ